jgi:hypothetical protein
MSDPELRGPDLSDPDPVPDLPGEDPVPDLLEGLITELGGMTPGVLTPGVLPWLGSDSEDEADVARSEAMSPRARRWMRQRKRQRQRQRFQESWENETKIMMIFSRLLDQAQLAHAGGDQQAPAPAPPTPPVELAVRSGIEWHRRYIPMEFDPIRPLVQGPGPRCPLDLKLLPSSEWVLGMCAEHVQGNYDCSEQSIRHFRDALTRDPDTV